jgi:hypothetical protein
LNDLFDNLNDTYDVLVNDLQLRVNINPQNDENNTHIPRDVDEDIEIDQKDKKLPVRETQTSQKRIITRAGREVKRPQRYGDFVTYQVSMDPSIYEPTVDYENPISMAATLDPDTMYYHVILNQPDKQQFIVAMEKDIEDHNKKEHWHLVRRSTLSPDTRILPSVWAMRRKRDLSTGKIFKWKARLNVDGSKQQL